MGLIVQGRAFAVAALLAGGTVARAQNAPAPGTAQASPETLDPSSPLAPLPELGVDWPDVGSGPASASATPGSVDAERRRHVSVSFEGTEPLDTDEADRGGQAGLRQRFDALSTLRHDRGDPANIAQIDRRARDDSALLGDLLRADGYYDASVAMRLRPAGDDIAVTFAVVPGARYRFAAVTLAGLDSTPAEDVRLRASFPVKPGDAVDAEKIQAAQAALRAEVGRRGFPFAKLPDPDIVVDHATHQATLALSVDLGVQRRFGAIRTAGKPPFSAAHVQQIARFHPGDRYDAAKIEDLRRALVATGLVSSVKLTPVAGATPDTVDIVASIDRAPPRTIASELGYGTGEGARLQLSWTHRNLLPPEGAVTFSGLAGTKEQSLGALLRRSNFRHRDQVLTTQVAASHSDLNAYNARSLTLSAGVERQTNIIWQKKWIWSYGAEFVATDERALPNADAADQTRRTYLVGALPTNLAYDGTDDLLNPSRGFRLSARVSPEASFLRGFDGYLKTQLDASAYRPVTDRIVLAGRVRVGSIYGIHTDGIAPSRRFYAGGGGSVRGYGYQDIGPRGADNDPVGGRSLAEFGLEARFRFGDFGVVPFLDGGNIYRATLPRFTGMRLGTGLGARYYTSFGPIRFDVGTPLARRKGDSRIAVYVSLGQAF